MDTSEIKQWLNLSVRIPKEFIEKFTDCAIELGAISVWIDCDVVENGTHFLNQIEKDELILTLTFKQDINPESFLQELCSEIGLKQNLRFELKWIPDREWVSYTQDLYKPIKISEALWICPSFEKITDKNAINVMIEPGMAFGTGTHPTTQMCLEWISKNAQNKTKALDYGCGTGILGITAFKCGIPFVTAVDNDKKALEITKSNSKLNGAEINVVHPETPINDSFDIVVANILANPLIEMKNELSRYVKPSGYLILSGIQAHQSEKVILEYSNLIKIMILHTQSDWVLLGGRKT